MCGSSDRTRLYRLPPFAVARCSACGFHYLTPRLPEAAMLVLYQRGDYFEGGDLGYDSYADQTRALRATFRRVAHNLVRSGLAGGDLLDVGCGYGLLLDQARGAFRSLAGTELSDEAAAQARRRGLDVVTGGLDALPGDRTFDCIVCAHVIEHVYDPRSFVATLRERLRPGGSVVIATPDMGSAWRRSLRSRWPSFKVPEHVLYFDRRTLARLLDEAGFDDVREFPYPHAFPLALIADKVGLGALGRLSNRLRSVSVWLPATTLALSARRPAADP